MVGVVIAVSPPSGTVDVEFEVLVNDDDYYAVFTFFWPTSLSQVSSLIEASIAAGFMPAEDPCILALKQALKSQRIASDLSTDAEDKPCQKIVRKLPFAVGSYPNQYEVRSITTRNGRDGGTAETVVVKLYGLEKQLKDTSTSKRVRVI
jgi:hypothetical protein